MNRPGSRQIAGVVVAAALQGGCVSLTPLPDQAPVWDRIEPTTQARYLLYVPSIYSDRRTWPLVVACHGTPPWDEAKWQMREWAQFAEDEGIIVAAPFLVGTGGFLPPPPAEQIERQRRDERAIVAIVNRLRSDYRIAREQVFMTGWSAGAFAVLHTGLRNPDLFRALAIRQGNFDERFMDVASHQLDRWQPVLVILGRTDMMRDQAKQCIEWLEDRGQFVESDEQTGSHRRLNPGIVWGYFQKIVRERPWIRIVHRPDSRAPLTVRFSVESVPPGAARKWFFGDGKESSDPVAVHTYERPGRYEVTANVALDMGKIYGRTRTIDVGFEGG